MCRERQLSVTAKTYKTTVCGLHSTGAALTLLFVFNCYLKFLKYVESFSCLTPSFRFPFSCRSKREEGTLSISARKQMDTSVHAQLSRLSPLLPLDPSRDSRDSLPIMAKKDLLFFAFDFVQCSKCMFQPLSVCNRKYH